MRFVCGSVAVRACGRGDVGGRWRGCVCVVCGCVGAGAGVGVRVCVCVCLCVGFLKKCFYFLMCLFVQQYISLRTYLAPAPVATYFEDRTHSLHRVIVDCGSPEHLVE